MRVIIILTIALLCFFNSSGQSSCEVSRLPIREKAALQKLLNELKAAINTKDKNRLADLFTFPLSCAVCIIDSTKDNADRPPVSRKQFVQSQYEVLFTRYFIEEINKAQLSNLVVSGSSRKGHCVYMFLYSIVKPSASWEGMQGLLGIEKVRGQYKITFIATVP